MFRVVFRHFFSKKATIIFIVFCMKLIVLGILWGEFSHSVLAQGMQLGLPQLVVLPVVALLTAGR